MFHAPRLFVASLLGAWLALAPACTKNEPSAPASTTAAPAATKHAPAPAATPAPAAAEPAATPVPPSASSPAAAAAAETPESPAIAETTTRQLNLENKPWTGDFDAILERRMIRALVPYSRTLYFTDKGRERGLSAELLRDFERYLNQKYAKSLGKRPITLYLIPTTRDRLLPDLAAGLGDIAAGNLTETPARLKIVDFVTPRDRKPVRELLITGPQSAPITRLEDLAGRRVHVRPATSYYESVHVLSGKLVRAGKPAIRIVPLPDALEDEDILEMLNAGLLEYVVVDDWKARIWAQVLPAIRVHEDLALREGGYIGWATRKNSPQLDAAINDFYANYARKQGVIDYRVAQFNKQVKQITNNTGDADWQRFQTVVELFRKYGTQYDFDPVMLAAQGYQESRLRQDAKSHVGAIGVMQVMPATGKELRVGDIREVEPNIHAGAKYMDQLMTRYFQDAHFSEDVRPLFAFAAYNAGPGNIAKMRREAAARGLNPDKWFNNVEIVTAEKIGIETTTYVRNIYKYYCAYKLALQQVEARRRAREQVAASAPADD
ncbi:membrane-bound lytic murein transglycosylase MltF [Lysobacter niastensis]|uniref:Membrane-bound lytic murein transglycosylase MltF n=1 Tax=Lysobacter niastensis TaxID=380629 RepID=A0ABU1W9L0_9GAMM|nr:transglycosylase SLT domain-containing protein [Lysobacter niastensis]MDR7134236.1 membrane-bound lytic murein transglycosylase MltF [Lysobacter niastensis]